MGRVIASASEIRRLVQARIYASTELDGHCRDCHANQIEKRAPDASGCNWELHSFNGAATCADVIARIVADLKAQYNLPD